MTSQTQQKINDLVMGKVLGRLACGGSMHYADGQDWDRPLVLKIKIGEDEDLEIPITGFDLRRDQGQMGITQITLVAREA